MQCKAKTLHATFPLIKDAETCAWAVITGWTAALSDAVCNCTICLFIMSYHGFLYVLRDCFCSSVFRWLYPNPVSNTFIRVRETLGSCLQMHAKLLFSSRNWWFFFFFFLACCVLMKFCKHFCSLLCYSTFRLWTFEHYQMNTAEKASCL